MALGFTSEEAEKLRRISMTLQRWHELECGSESGCIERDEKTGLPYWRSSGEQSYPLANYAQLIPDREKGAKKRLAAIMHQCNERRYVGDDASTHSPNCDDLSAYIQTDPRGAALYILRPGDVPEGQTADAYYSRGVCVY
jgi:hypothetical protein